MVENQHKLIKGYRDLSEQDIATMNAIKQHERAMAGMAKDLRDMILERANIPAGNVTLDPRVNESLRQVALARTAFEVAFYHLVRAVAAPDSPWI